MTFKELVKMINDYIMPVTNSEEEEEEEEVKKADAKANESAKTVVSQQAKQNAQETAQNAAQPQMQTQMQEQMQVQAQKQAIGGFGAPAGSMSFTRTGGTVSTADNGVTSMDGLHFQAFNSETSVRPSLAVVKAPQLTMKIYAPTEYDEQVKSIVTDLKKKTAVIVNFEHVDEEKQQRIGDFILGAVYSINGKPEVINNKIVLYVPDGVEYEDAARSVSSMRAYN
ncbi:MAG: cell division protein SepF [Selenomonadaceae bacterium]|nr:cell division protein SepF [Selenomonadaceae bacterium]